MSVMTVHFVDFGQDFLEFDIADSKIIASRPAEIRSWRQFQVLTPESEIEPGVQLLVRNRKLSNSPVLAIKYPVVKIERHQVM